MAKTPPTTTPPTPPASTTAEADMVTLIEFLRDNQGAAARHDSVTLPDGRTLDALFAVPADLLTHLKTGAVIQDSVEPAGTKLVEPGKPNDSAFFRIIQRTGHPMKAKFALAVPAVGKTGVQIVAAWITGLT